ncbi:hypothetical protein ACFFNY_02980 [Paenibacillus hodogayensis]|uniref:DUF4305 domain-containing protein n=1 Tax=Paenibacillus hodogayensis TaxID=279208 RepID=A0ABV5VQH6_9BACL
MRCMLRWFNRIHLVWAFALLTVAHFVLYYSLGNANWLMLAVLAALVDTGAIAVVQLVGKQFGKEQGK